MNKYRYNEYYEMTKVFDTLYENSKANKHFRNLMGIITDKKNIKLAFRTIKSNHGSNTKGVDGLTIKEIKDKEINNYVDLVREKFNNYEPDMVRRVYIPKTNGDKRPLGIPTIIDRLMQQCIKQVLEPICEAKFHPHSYGFRPNRTTNHAIARMKQMANLNGYHYIVDVDLKGFFDNVNHNKLIKQIYSIGIRDMKLLMIIKKMVKAPIDKGGIPSKGTPQGGILSPLLANIVLNELDWWISSQWETFKSKKKYSSKYSMKNQLIKKTKLKQIYIIRYADDFKVMCKNYNTANRIFIATKDWLGKRLKLEINKEKSKITNLKNEYTEFLGFKFKLKPKGKTKLGVVIKSHISDKAKCKILENSRKQIKIIQKNTTSKEINKLNAMILGIQEYYKTATNVNIDCSEIAFKLDRLMKRRFAQIGKYTYLKGKSPLFDKLYGKTLKRVWLIKDIAIFPLWDIRHKSPMNFNQNICDYTLEGRKLSSKALKNNTNKIVMKLMKNHEKNESIQYHDNKLSRVSMCNARCEVTGIQLEFENIYCHRVVPKENGGSDEYSNLKIVHKNIHKLIHTNNQVEIYKYINLITGEEILKKINKLRLYCEISKIEMSF
ncbi:group II intron reverse transcriptase/maturase [Clostridium sporogenes]